MSQRTKLILSWAAVVLWAAFIFFMSAHTGADLDEGTDFAAQVKRWLTALAAPVFGEGVDVVSPAAHFTEYAVFGALLFAALVQTRPQHRRVALVAVAVAIASVYGVTDELHQSFVPDRACDPADWLVDTLGATLGAFLTSRVFFASRVFRNKSEARP